MGKKSKSLAGASQVASQGAEKPTQSGLFDSPDFVNPFKSDDSRAFKEDLVAEMKAIVEPLYEQIEEMRQDLRDVMGAIRIMGAVGGGKQVPIVVDDRKKVSRKRTKGAFDNFKSDPAIKQEFEASNPRGHSEKGGFLKFVSAKWNELSEEEKAMYK